MRALIEKELRENLRWLPLAMLFIGVLLWYEVSNIAGNSSMDFVFNMTVMFAGSITACVLGVLQSAFDLRSSARSYLWHRSVSSRSIYYSKLLVGALIYFLAIGVLLAWVALWFASKGILYQPMRPLQVLPATLMAIACFAFHPAAMYMMARRGRWFGTKLLPVFGAMNVSICCMVLSVELFRFSFPLIAFLSVLVLAMLAAFIKAAENAWGESLNNDDGVPKVQTGLVRSLVLSGAGMFAWVVAFFVGMIFIQIAMIPNDYRTSYPIYAVDNDGNLWYARYESAKFIKGELVPGHFVSGAPVREAEVPNPNLNLPEGIQLKNLTHSQLLYDEKGCFEDLHTNHPEFRVFDRRGYVLIYEVGKIVRKLPALQAIVSRDGIHSPGETLGKPFRGNPGSAFKIVREGLEGWPSPEIWVDQDGVYLFHEKSGMFRTLKSMPVDAARFVSLNGNAPMMLLLSSNDQFVCYRVVDQDGETLSSTALWNLHEGSIELRELAVLPKLPVPLDEVRIEATGEMKLTAMYESPRPTVATFDTNADSAWKIRHFQDPKTDQTESRLQHNLEYLSPAVVPPLYGAFLSAFTSNGLRSWDHLVYFLQEYPAFIYLVVLVMLSAIAATAWACRRRRLSIRQTLQWCAATLLLGWGGPIAVLAIYTQPKLQRCPRCDKQRRIDQRTCEHCGVAWEPPSNEGIEIYDDPIITVRSEVVSV